MATMPAHLDVLAERPLAGGRDAGIRSRRSREEGPSAPLASARRSATSTATEPVADLVLPGLD
ncbi:MAG: hypothetical protein QOF29_1077, partial [bacterium]